jgi:hypothetical protein
MRPLNPQPVVQVVDIAGNPTPFSGMITAAISAGDAVVRAGASATADAQGRVVFSDLTLGAKEGSVGLATLRFSGAGLDADTVAVRLGCADRVAEIGRTFIGRFQDGDCRFTSGRWLQRFRVVNTGPATAHILEADGSESTLLFVRGPNQPSSFWNLGASFITLMPAGTMEFSPTYASVGVEGPYSLRVTPTSTDIRCVMIMVGTPLNLTGQRLGDGDCRSGDFWGDFLYFGLPTGATVTASVSNATFAPFVAIWRDNAQTSVASAQGQNAASAIYTNATGGNAIHYVYIGSFFPNTTGTYNLEFRITYPQSSGLLSGADAAGFPARPRDVISDLPDPQELMEVVTRARVGGR